MTLQHTPSMTRYLLKFPSSRSSAVVQPHWPQYRVNDGIVARHCSSLPWYRRLRHKHMAGCVAFYPDDPGEAA